MYKVIFQHKRRSENLTLYSYETVTADIIDDLYRNGVLHAWYGCALAEDMLAGTEPIPMRTVCWLIEVTPEDD